MIEYFIVFACAVAGVALGFILGSYLLALYLARKALKALRSL